MPGMSPGLPPHNAIAPNPPHPSGLAWAVQPLRSAPLPDASGQGTAALCWLQWAWRGGRLLT